MARPAFRWYQMSMSGLGKQARRNVTTRSEQNSSASVAWDKADDSRFTTDSPEALLTGRTAVPGARGMRIAAESASRQFAGHRPDRFSFLPSATAASSGSAPRQYGDRGEAASPSTRRKTQNRYCSGSN